MDRLSYGSLRLLPDLLQEGHKLSGFYPLLIQSPLLPELEDVGFLSLGLSASATSGSITSPGRESHVEPAMVNFDPNTRRSTIGFPPPDGLRDPPFVDGLEV